MRGEPFKFSGMIDIDDSLPSSRVVQREKKVVCLRRKDRLSKRRYRLQKSKKDVWHSSICIKIREKTTVSVAIGHWQGYHPLHIEILPYDARSQAEASL
jgi:hypothetical protein